MTALSDLIARLEAAKDGSWDLTAAIYEAIGCDAVRTARKSNGYAWRYRGTNPRGRLAVRWETMQPLTTSLDAALTLVPRDLSVRLYWNTDTACATLGPKRAPDYDDVEAPTPALAICIAALKAREAAR